MKPRNLPVFTWLARGLPIAIALALASLAGAPLRSQEAKTPPALRQVPADAAAFLYFRPGDVWASEMLAGTRDMLRKAGPGVLDAVAKRFNPPLDTLDGLALFIIPGDDEAPATIGGVASFRTPFDSGKVPKALFPRSQDKDHFGQRYADDTESGLAMKVVDNKTLLLAPREHMSRLLSHEAKQTGPIAKHFAAAASHTAFAAVDVEAMPADWLKLLPEPLRLLTNAKEVTVSSDVGKDTALKLRLRYADAETATAAEQAATEVVDTARKQVGEAIAEMTKKLAGPDAGPAGLVDLPHLAQQMFALSSTRVLDELLAGARFERSGDTLALNRRIDPTNPQTVATASGITAGLFVPALTRTREAAGRVRSQNNLKLLALAMLGYHEANGTFPPWAIYSKDGKRPLLSWRVAVLPYLEQGELYKQFKLDEPWDSEHNRRLVAKMPKVFADQDAPPSSEPGQTHYQVFVGGGAGFRFDPRGIRVVDVTDGTSNTILVATATDAVPWTKPEDLTYSARKPLPKLGLGGKPANVALYDGSVRVLSPKLSERTLRSAITSSGNELLGDDW